MALYLVLAVLLIVVILANVSLTMISSQSKLTQHQVKRIQAYYAGQAGMNMALEQLRLQTPGWVSGAGSPVTKYLCRDSANPPCDASGVIIDADLPTTIRYVKIVIEPPDGTDRRTINTTVNYTSAQ